MNELELIVDLHKDNERQGPGSVQDTCKALSFIPNSSDKILEIADLGCGTGAQTLDLANNSNAKITAVDIFPEFLNRLNEHISDAGLDDRIVTKCEDINDLSFEPESLDIIWSEGAIYNLGFEKGVKYWKKFLRPGGYIAVSEITWITAERPVKIEDFWKTEYPEIDRASGKIQILEENGYSLAGYFYLNKNSWLEKYYYPLEASIEGFLKRHPQKELADKIVKDCKAEQKLYETYSDYFSYGFYVAKKEV